MFKFRALLSSPRQFCCSAVPSSRRRMRRPRFPSASTSGFPPFVPTATSTTLRMTARPTATTDPTGLRGGVFLGAGPWFRGPRGFYGHVDNRYDPHHGYNGPLPGRGARPFYHFQGNEARDGRGHVGNPGHDAGGEHALPGYRGGGARGGHPR